MENMVSEKEVFIPKKEGESYKQRELMWMKCWDSKGKITEELKGS